MGLPREVDVAGPHRLERVRRLLRDPQVPVAWMDVDRADVPVAVRRRKAPRPAPALGGVENSDAAFLLLRTERG